jgi:hypothetical protein
MTLGELFKSDEDVVLASFDSVLFRQSQMTAYALMHLAVIDARNMYLRAGFESMKAFCMSKMQLTEDAAYKRIHVARLAGRLPRLFSAIAKGELSAYDIRLLAPRLTPSNVEDLVAECAYKSSVEIEGVLARRFPRAEELRLDEGISLQLVPISDESAGKSAEVIASPSVDLVSHADRHVKTAPRARTKLEQLSESRFTLQVTLSGRTHDKLRRLQDLLSHAVPTRDIAEVIDRSFDALIDRLEKRKFGSGASAELKEASCVARTIPARIRKAVFERDGGKCAYRFPDGRICGSRSKLEFDHIIPIAKGGKTRVDNLRLLCRAHNQHAADQAFGQAFMDRKRARRR